MCHDRLPASWDRVYNSSVSTPLKSCGILIVRGSPLREFLLMRHADRWDLPKGHVDPGETEIECALRELQEETGITSDAIEIDPAFRFTQEYRVLDRGAVRDKTLVVFLATLIKPVEIQLTEHIGYEWFPWPPAQPIQAWTIDPLLHELSEHLS
jgi:8-oxo-dGTP pyrophosphatase MutT (NUDIX family)